MVEKVRNAIFDGENPFNIIRTWMGEAKKTELNDHDAIALSTVDKNGMPNVRMVLLRYILEDSFVFFSNYNSQKGKEIDFSGNISFLIHWKSLKRQIRVRGRVSKDKSDLSDKYYDGRGYLSKIGAWSSKQSDILNSREDLMQNIEYYKKKFKSNPPKPPHWGGYVIKPLEIEFWNDGDHRLHDRFKWTRKSFNESWEINRLFP